MIKPSNIDSTSYFIENGDVTPVAVGTTNVKLKDITVPNSGIYMISIFNYQQGTSTSGALVYLSIRKNNTELIERNVATVKNYAGNESSNTVLVYGFTANAGDVVSIYTRKNRADFSSNLGCIYTIVQVA